MSAPRTPHLESTAPEAVLERALHHAAHLVPAQSPLDRFVHHNPLHAFEEEPFDAAVIHAAEIYGNEPFWREEAYRQAFARGRILDVDLDEVLAREVEDGPVGGVVSRRQLVRSLLRHPLDSRTGASLRWWLTETDALTRLRSDLPAPVRAAILAEAGGEEERAVGMLWSACSAAVVGLATAPPDELPVGGPRVRDQLVRRLGRDPDVLVHPVLIRWSAAYLDHGVSYWPMLGREAGFYEAFLAHFTQPLDLGRPWMHTLRALGRRARTESWSAEAMCVHALTALGHAPEDWEEVVVQTLLALSGWSGMFQRLHDRPDTAPEPLGLPSRLVDMLAVRLLLDLSAAAHFLGKAGGGGLLAAAEALPLPEERVPQADPAWQLFQLAQVLGLGAHTVLTLGLRRVQLLLDAVAEVSDLERRRLWHTAYERRFRVENLDAIAAHVDKLRQDAGAAVRVQLACCIDDREESFRRLLEEVAPWVQTFGVAGNYGISMYYHGLEHGHPVALGPGGFEPRHLVVEVAEPGHEPKRTRWKGLLRHNLDVGSQTLVRGMMVTMGGALSAVPLSMRLLAPRMHAQLTKRDLPERSSLRCERQGEETDAHGLLLGFSVDEMVGIVKGTLEFMSLLRDFAPLVICLGHGSRSMNNPHEAAHDCGACGGGRGGPNARLFAHMANDPRVRARLAEEAGIVIPDSTWFVGGYHNTADDAVDLYETWRVPEAQRALFAEARVVLDEARRLDALERCRKFEAVPLGVTPAEALLHVENRIEDLAQPRPEYGHCTNAICLVGRREWSKGLFLDRRAFLCSYDPDVDPDGAILSRLLAMAVPVGAGINLEYWFSVVDNTGYGCGTKLPHNITGLIGVMDGHQSDLRTGLPWQMVELHEPVRLLCVVEATPARLLAVAAEHPAVGRLVVNGWVQLASLDPETGELQLFEDGAFRPWQPERRTTPEVSSSLEWMRGTRGFLPAATIVDPGGAA